MARNAEDPCSLVKTLTRSWRAREVLDGCARRAGLANYVQQLLCDMLGA